MDTPLDEIPNGAEISPNAYLVDFDYLKSHIQDIMGSYVFKQDSSDGTIDNQTLTLHYNDQSVVISDSIATSEQPLLYILPNSIVQSPVKQMVPNRAQESGKQKPSPRRTISLDEYRKQVGIKVHNQHPNEKLGIKVNNTYQVNSGSPILRGGGPSTCEDKDVYLPKGKVNLCNYCGYLSELANKCQRCGRKIINGKIIDVPVTQDTTKSPQSPSPISKESFYSGRKGRCRATQRQIRAKIEEPQCVTLSSDEEETTSSVTRSEPEAKKIKSETNRQLPHGAAVSSDHALSNTLHSQSVKTYERNIKKPGKDTSNTSRQEHEEQMEPSDSGTTLATLQQEKSIGEVKSQDEVSDEIHPKKKLLEEWKELGLKGPFFTVSCRTVRIGSYKVAPSDRVLFSSEGIMIEVPIVGVDSLPSTKTAKIVIQKREILKLNVHFGASLPAMFVYATPTCGNNLRKILNMDKNSDPSFDPLSTDERKKRITLLPDKLTEEAKNAIRQAFSPMGVFKEISSLETNKILVMSSHSDVISLCEQLNHSGRLTGDTESKSTMNTSTSKENVTKSEARVTRAASRSSVPSVPRPPVLLMFNWSEGLDRFSVTTEDYICLNDDHLLNDSIIDFYLRYLFSTKLQEQQKNKYHVFSSFFYQRLTSRPTRQSGRKHPIEDDPKLSAAEKRHHRVKSWTKKVDIFDKDYLIIPINEHSHWFLAIICFPGLSGPVKAKDNTPVVLPQPLVQPVQQKKETPMKVPLDKLLVNSGQSFLIGSTTITPVSTTSKNARSTIIPVTLDEETDKDEAESEEDVAAENEEPSLADTSVVNTLEDCEPIKQPCILIFDSLAGSSRSRVVATLRDYLRIEYITKKGSATVDSNQLFSKENFKGTCLKVPQQNNYSDCGVYVLQYVESFIENPFEDYRLPMKSLRDWFSVDAISRKRKEIQNLLISLMKEENPNCESVLKSLTPEERVNEKTSASNEEKENEKSSNDQTVNKDSGNEKDRAAVEIPEKTVVVSMFDVLERRSPVLGKARKGSVADSKMEVDQGRRIQVVNEDHSEPMETDEC